MPAAVWRPLSQMLLQPSAAALCCSAAAIPQHLGEALRGARVVQVHVSLLGWVVTQVVQLRGVAVVRVQRRAGVRQLIHSNHLPVKGEAALGGL